MICLNMAQIIGYVGRDPDIRFTANNIMVANLSIATSASWKDKNTGEKKETTEWHRIVTFGKLAEVVNSMVRKGTRIYVAGNLRTKKWTDNNGVDRYTTEIIVQGFDGKIIVLDKKGDSAQGFPNTQPQRTNNPVDESVPF